MIFGGFAEVLMDIRTYGHKDIRTHGQTDLYTKMRGCSYKRSGNDEEEKEVLPPGLNSILTFISVIDGIINIKRKEQKSKRDW